MTAPAPTLTSTDQTGYAGWRSALVLSAAEQQTCRDVHQLHQLVLTGFREPHLTTAVPAAPTPHVLYAAARRPAERDANRKLVAGLPEKIVVQSPVRPNWQPLLDSQRLAHANTFEIEQTYRVSDDVEVRVIANPTYRDNQTGRRIGITSAAECGAWLLRHLARHGLDVAPDRVVVGPGERLTGTDGKGHNITVIGRELRAQGTVHDPQAFHQAITSGLGRAKPYGCGLLLTRPRNHSGDR